MVAMRDVQTAAGRFADVAPVGGGFGGVLWGSAGIIVPWEVYLQYKDVGLLERHYPAMVAYMDYLETTIDPKTGLSSDGQLGDWLGPQNNLLGSAFLVTAYHAYDLGIMAKVADILGKSNDAETTRVTIFVRQPRGPSTFPVTSAVDINSVLGSENLAQVMVSCTGISTCTETPLLSSMCDRRMYGQAGPPIPRMRVAATQWAWITSLRLVSKVGSETKVAAHRRRAPPIAPSPSWSPRSARLAIRSSCFACKSPEVACNID
jgi:hypothetical protein